MFVSQPSERALLLKLLQFPEALETATTEYRPHYIAQYLFETANAFSTFYSECPVKDAEDPRPPREPPSAVRLHRPHRRNRLGPPGREDDRTNVAGQGCVPGVFHIAASASFINDSVEPQRNTKRQRVHRDKDFRCN